MLAGRAHEQAVLRECLAAAVAGRGRLALIAGEAGIGKTALVGAFTREAQAQAACMETEDFARAYRAFAAKQTPKFEGN